MPDLIKRLATLYRSFLIYYLDIFPTSSYTGAGVLKNGVVSFDRSSYTDWNALFTSSGVTPGTAPATSLWKTETINIPVAALSSSQFRIRFKLTTDGSVLYYGWLIDDVKISGSNNITWSPITNLYIDNTATPTAYNPLVHTNQLTVYAHGGATSQVYIAKLIQFHH